MNDDFNAGMQSQWRRLTEGSANAAPPPPATDDPSTQGAMSAPAPASTVEIAGVDFLRAVLPESGEYIAAIDTGRKLANGKTAFDQYPFASVQALHAFLLECDGRGEEVFFATAAFVEQVPGRRGCVRRTKELVREKRSLYLDLDVQKPGEPQSGAYATRDEALAAIPRIEDLLGGIAPTIVVYSGNGLHLHWVFDRDLAAAEWKTLADVFKQRLIGAKICFDHNIPADAARILRAPGTHNHKPHTPDDMRLVRALRRGGVVSVDALRTALVAPLGQAGMDLPAPPSVQVDSGLGFDRVDLPQALKPAERDNSLQNCVDMRTRWDKARQRLLDQATDDAAAVAWLSDLFDHTPDELWDGRNTWRVIASACHGLVRARPPLGAQVLALLALHSNRPARFASRTGQDASADVQAQWAEGDGTAALGTAMSAATANGWRDPFDAEAHHAAAQSEQASAAAPTENRMLFRDKDALKQWLATNVIYVREGDAYAVTDQAVVRLRKGDALAEELQRFAPIGSDKKHVNVRLLLRTLRAIRVVDRIEYVPGEERVFRRDDVEVLNSYHYTPPTILQATSEEDALWDEFMEHLFPSTDPDCAAGRERIWQSLAWLVQDESRRLPVAVLLVGAQGSGKSTLMDKVVRLVLGRHNVGSVTAGELDSPFNDWVKGIRALVIPELRMASGRDARRLADMLKPITTDEVVRISPKGYAGYEQPNALSIFATSNYDDAVKLDEDDRRWMAVKTPAGRMPDRLAKRLHAWLGSNRAPGVLRGWLMGVDLGQFEPHALPRMTEAKRQMLALSRDPAQRVVVEQFERHASPFDQPYVTTADVREGLMEEGFEPRELSDRMIVGLLKSPPISAREIGKHRVQARGQDSGAARNAVRVYVAKRDESERCTGSSGAFIRKARERKPVSEDRASLSPLSGVAPPPPPPRSEQEGEP